MAHQDKLEEKTTGPYDYLVKQSLATGKLELARYCAANGHLSEAIESAQEAVSLLIGSRADKENFKRG